MSFAASLYPGDAVVLSLVRIAVFVSGLAVTALLIGRIANRAPEVRYAAGIYAFSAILLSPLIVWITNQVPVLPVALSVNSTDVSAINANLASTDGLERAFGSLFLIWVAGIAFGLVRFAAGCRSAALMRRSARPADDWILNLSPHAQSGDLGQDRIYTSRSISVPVVAGIFRPVIILPEQILESLTPGELRAVLTHEYAHILLNHSRHGLAQRLALILFWPNPFIHFLSRMTTRAREEVCDNSALQVTGAACYARTLLTIAERATYAPQCSPTLALLGPEWRLEERISGLLNPRRNRMIHAKRWKLWMIVMALVAVGAVFAGTRVKAASRKADHAIVLQNPAIELVLDGHGQANGANKADVELSFSGGSDITLRQAPEGSASPSGSLSLKPSGK